jgi:hypothetical protein
MRTDARALMCPSFDRSIDVLSAAKFRALSHVLLLNGFGFGAGNPDREPMRDRKPPLVRRRIVLHRRPWKSAGRTIGDGVPGSEKSCLGPVHMRSAVAKEEPRPTSADQSRLSSSASAASGSIFPVKQCAGQYGRVVTLPGTITGNLRIGNADSLDLALNSALMSRNVDG